MMISENAVPAAWLVPDGLSARDLTARLDGLFRPELAGDHEQRMVLHDTFAWQLWNQGLLLAQLDGTSMLCPVEQLTPEGAIARCDRVAGKARFWWDWPPGELRSALEPLIGIRGLMPIVEVMVQSQRIDLRNADDKTVAWIYLQRFVRDTSQSQQSLATCNLVPLRGYDRECLPAQRVLTECLIASDVASPLPMIMEQAARKPGPWSSKPDCEITADLTVREALRRLVASSLDIARRCEQGIIDDVDTEFLHDYRVCLRRVRSALKLLKDVYPATVSDAAKDQLGGFARITNRLRDLDVYLLGADEYAAGVPGDLAGSLDAMFEDLSAQRAQQQRQVCEHLTSPEYQAQFERLAGMFDADRWWPVTVHSHLPVARLADRVIPKRYRKVCQLASALAPRSPDSSVHDVRLEAKKLRYLLEFFGDLYPPGALKQLVKRLKGMQSVLGSFNDLAVQQEALRDYIYTKAQREPQATMLILAVGSLLGMLHVRQQEVRGQVSGALAEFADGPTQDLIRQLFSRGTQAA